MANRDTLTPMKIDFMESGRIYDPLTPGLRIEALSRGKKRWKFRRRLPGRSRLRPKIRADLAFGKLPCEIFEFGLLLAVGEGLELVVEDVARDNRFVPTFAVGKEVRMPRPHDLQGRLMPPFGFAWRILGCRHCKLH